MNRSKKHLKHIAYEHYFNCGGDTVLGWYQYIVGGLPKLISYKRKENDNARS